MRGLALLVLLVVLVGCEQTQRIDRAALDQRYQETQLADGVLSIVPLRIEPNATPPTVVNWWYAGTADSQHRVVYRSLTWDTAGKPVGQETSYRIPADQLKIAQPVVPSSDAARWLPLYEAAPDEIKPPTDLPTARQAPSPVDNDPIRLPDEAVVPPTN